MVAIQHPTLQKQFDQFSKLGTDEEKRAFWELFNKDFESKTEAEQASMRQAWEANFSKIEKRLKTIDAKLEKQVSEISVYPANEEEASLLTALLERMGVRFAVG